MKNILRSILKPYRKHAYKPIIQSKESDVYSSKYGGYPYLSQQDGKQGGYPRCKCCNQPEELFLQLNIDKLPIKPDFELPKGGLLQIFYCVNERCKDSLEHAEEAFTKYETRRIIVPNREEEPYYEKLDRDFKIKPKSIIGWSKIEDYPADDPYDPELPVQITEDPILYECYIKNHSEYSAKKGDKYLGWPFWTQDVNYPYCPQCNEQMEVIFQIDSLCNLNYMFGDTGTAHVTICHNHPQVIGFGWSSQ